MLITDQVATADPIQVRSIRPGRFTKLYPLTSTQHSLLLHVAQQETLHTELSIGPDFFMLAGG